MLDAGSAPVVCWSCLWITADAADASLCTESPCGHWQCVPQANIGLSRLSSGVSPIPKDGAHKIVVPQDVRVLREPRASGSELRALNSRGFRYASVAACCSCSETPTLPSSRCSSIGPVLPCHGHHQSCRRSKQVPMTGHAVCFVIARSNALFPSMVRKGPPCWPRHACTAGCMRHRDIHRGAPGTRDAAGWRSQAEHRAANLFAWCAAVSVGTAQMHCP